MGLTFSGRAGRVYGVWNAWKISSKTRRRRSALERMKKGHPTESHHEMARVSYFKELETRFIPDAAARYQASDGFGADREAR